MPCAAVHTGAVANPGPGPDRRPHPTLLVPRAGSGTEDAPYGDDGVVEIRRATDHVTMPWANGRGTTLELAIHPDGATLASLEWRISIATVA